MTEPERTEDTQSDHLVSGRVDAVVRVCGSQLETVDQLHRFLQGTVPVGYNIDTDHVPKLTPEQAWTVVWYVQNLHMKLSDEIDRCDVCGEIYDSAREGDCLDFGDAPYHFCDGCYYSDAHANKLRRRESSKP